MANPRGQKLSFPDERKKELSDDALELIAARFRLLSEPTRLKILHALGHGEMSVNDIVEATGASQANVSKQLAALLDAAIVARRKQGLRSNYRVVDPSIFALCDLVCSRLKDEVQARHAVLSTT